MGHLVMFILLDRFACQSGAPPSWFVPAMACSKRSRSALERYAKDLQEAESAKAPKPILDVEELNHVVSQCLVSFLVSDFMVLGGIITIEGTFCVSTSRYH